MSDEAGLQRALLGEDILRTARQAAAVNFLLARLAAAFLGAAFMPALRPRRIVAPAKDMSAAADEIVKLRSRAQREKPTA
jgi:hypothetical protein